MSQELPFWKYHGLGNDFVLVREPLGSEAARTLCHRKLGVGGDGVLELTIPGPEGTDAAVTVWNSDGSRAEICGNGLRCAALHLHELAGLDSPMTVATGAGPRRCEVLELLGGGRALVEVEMGRGEVGRGSMIEEEVDLDGRRLRLTAVSMGNPHAVTFDPVAQDDIPRLGARLEGHERFPEGVNAGFARMLGAGEIGLTVWERGAGLTGACGSGACAAAVAACATGRAQPETSLRVVQPGGELTITVSSEGRVVMSGAAQRVFRGSLDRGGLSRA